MPNLFDTLPHNIGAHIEQVLGQLSARAVLDQVFTTYRTDVVDRAYHQLRTTDHVSRFRPGVIEALAQLSRAEQLLQSARQMRSTGNAEVDRSAATNSWLACGVSHMGGQPM
jgi:hypothetical protein